MSDAASTSAREFAQRRWAALQPYWLYSSLSLAAILLLRPWMACLLVAAIIVPKLIIPARVRVEQDGLVLSAWLAERRIAWRDILKATVQGKGWRETVRLEGAGQARPMFLNIGYFNDRQGIAKAIADAAGSEHPLSRSVNSPPT